MNRFLYSGIDCCLAEPGQEADFLLPRGDCFYVSNLIYVGTRQDGSKGSGKINDPYDVGTQPKFDAVMNNLPAVCHVIILPGDYETTGITLNPRPGLAGIRWIQGSGIGITTIKLVNLGNITGGRSIFAGFDDTCWIRISDMSLDCNNKGQDQVNSLNLTACSMACSYGQYENLDVTDCAGYPGEAFFVSLINSSSVAAKCYMRNVTVHDCSADSATCITAFNQNNGSLGPGTMSGVIDSCRVENCPNCSAFGPGGNMSGYLINSTVINSSLGAMDTGIFNGIYILNNYFDISDDGTNHGFIIGGGGGFSWNNFHIEGNTFIVGDSTAAILLSGTAPFNGLFIRDNTFRKRSGSSNTTRYITQFVNGRTTAPIILTDNWADPSFSSNPAPVAGAIQVARNYYISNGSAIPNLP